MREIVPSGDLEDGWSTPNCQGSGEGDKEEEYLKYAFTVNYFYLH